MIKKTILSNWFKRFTPDIKNKLYITVEFDKTKIIKLYQDSNCKSYMELINSALTLYEWSIEHRKLGHEIAAVDEKADTYSTVEIIKD